MSPLLEHDDDSYLLGRFVDVLTEELGLTVKAGRSTTLRRRRKQRGIEADNCYWIANEPRMRGKRRLDLRVDPPPDLAIEVDVFSSSLDRLAIYAALRVPEVWRLEGRNLTFYVLGTDDEHAVSPTSKAFPGLTPADLLQHLALAQQMDENAVVRAFRAWVRQHLVNHPGGSVPPP